jgi:hypothetical protein
VRKILTGKITPVKVEIRKTDSAYQLIREGKPYFVRGAGGTAYPDRIKAFGGNSIRTWGNQGCATSA